MVLITGASSGIGQAIAEKLAHAGKSLFLVARRNERLRVLQESLLQAIGQKFPNLQIHIASLDVSDPESIQNFVQNHSQILQGVDVLINNAGLALGASPVHEAKFSDAQKMIDTNLTGVIAMTEAVLPFLLQRKQADIVNMGSVAGRWVYPNGNVYCATKAAISAWNEGLRLDLMGKGIRVMEICPGMVETEFSQVRFSQDLEKARAVYQGLDALQAQDIAEVVEFALNRPRHVNIQQLVVYPSAQASTQNVFRTRLN